MCGYIVVEIGDVGCYLRFANEGKSSAKMRKIIEQNEVVLITEDASNRRCPHVTMNKFKRHGSI